MNVCMSKLDVGIFWWTSEYLTLGDLSLAEEVVQVGALLTARHRADHRIRNLLLIHDF